MSFLTKTGPHSLCHAQVDIEIWQKEYNIERPKNALGGLAMAAYAEALAERAGKLSLDSNAPCYLREAMIRQVKRIITCSSCDKADILSLYCLNSYSGTMQCLDFFGK